MILADTFKRYYVCIFKGAKSTISKTKAAWMTFNISVYLYVTGTNSFTMIAADWSWWLWDAMGVAVCFFTLIVVQLWWAAMHWFYGTYIYIAPTNILTGEIIYTISNTKLMLHTQTWASQHHWQWRKRLKSPPRLIIHEENMDHLLHLKFKSVESKLTVCQQLPEGLVSSLDRPELRGIVCWQQTCQFDPN